MAGPKVTFKITSVNRFTHPSVPYQPATANQFVPKYVEGQIIFVEDLGQIFLDFHDYRVCYSQSIKDAGGIRYLGIADSGFNPDMKSTWIVGGKLIEPEERDIIVYQSKEYMYRKGENGILAWFEIGDEQSPTWTTDDSLSWEDDTQG